MSEESMASNRQHGRAATDLSVFALATLLLQRRRMIVVIAILVAIVSVVPALLGTRVYAANALFVPETAENTRSGLSDLAGQFGFSLGNTGGSQSPEFYRELMESRVVLAPVVNQPLPHPEQPGTTVSYADLFRIEGNPEQRLERSIGLLSGQIESSVGETGTVQMVVRTPWRSVSVVLAERVLAGINEFNRKSRQGKASGEREFVAQQLKNARDSLNAAQDRLETFLRSNRDFSRSPELTSRYSQLTAGVSLWQQLVVTRMQAYEDARVREVRDAPAVTVIEPPVAPTTPEPRRLVMRGVVGLAFGTILGTLIALITGLFAPRAAVDPDEVEFRRALREIRQNPVSLLTGPTRRVERV